MDNFLFCLIVDDEPLAQQVLENYIARVDQLELVCKCESVEEAYEVINTQPIDVVFLDLNLGAMSGIDLMKKTVDQKKKVYLIITSSLSPEQVKWETSIQSDNFVLVDHLTKPFSFQQFLKSIEKVKEIK